MEPNTNPVLERILTDLIYVAEGSDGYTVGLLRKALRDAYQEGYHEGREQGDEAGYARGYDHAAEVYY